MNKWFIVLFIVLGLSSCSKNEQFYKTHPDALQQALKACPAKQPQGITCQKLAVLAQHLTVLAYELQRSPQDFGQKIMALQETIAKEQGQLHSEETTTNIQTSLAQNHLELGDRLAIVRWFESPVSE